MKQFFLGLGSNLGNSKKNIEQALQYLEQNEAFFDFSMSHLYRTSPISDIPQQDFINAVCTFKTDLSPDQVYECTCQIEQLFGSKPLERNAPRFLDIDLIFIENTQLDTDLLKVPHPEWLNRLFVLVPFLDVLPANDQEQKKMGLSRLQFNLVVDQLKKETEQLIEQI